MYHSLQGRFWNLFALWMAKTIGLLRGKRSAAPWGPKEASYGNMDSFQLWYFQQKRKVCRGAVSPYSRESVREVFSWKVVHCSLRKYERCSRAFLSCKNHTLSKICLKIISEKKLTRLSRRQLYKRLLANAYFFLSFENSHCQDYVTEKFFYALDSPALPIVMGPNRYLKS